MLILLTKQQYQNTKVLSANVSLLVCDAGVFSASLSLYDMINLSSVTALTYDSSITACFFLS